MEENSISIINRTNGQLVGEKAQALPIKMIGGLKWTQYVLIGVIIGLLVMVLIVATIKKQVVAVEVSGKASDFQVFQIK